MTPHPQPHGPPALPLPPPVRDIEAWLRDLAAPPSDGGDTRVLFILDNDFGELTTVMYWVLGQPCFQQARVLASPRLHEANGGALPGRVSLWKTEQDLMEAIADFRPEVVVLASGYLLPVHGLLSLDALARLREHAGKAGAALVTTDPFLGLVTRPPGQAMADLISIQIPDGAPAQLREAKKLGDHMLHTRLGGAELVLRDLPHLYPSHVDLGAVAVRPQDGRNLSFFNDALLVPPGLMQAARAGDDPYWMFLIAQADHQTQCMFHGPAAFARMVADRLGDAVRLGRRAVLLGPSELLAEVRPLLGREPRVELLSFCAFGRAMSLLLAAEYCFYWNLVSHSIIMPLWNGRPVVLFDQGHLVRAVPTIRERIIAWYYQGWEPPQLDQGRPLTPDGLAAALAGHAAGREAFMARYRRAPSPRALLLDILRRQGRGLPTEA